jgi:hypothetical protein
MAGTFEPDSVISSAPGTNNGPPASADQLDKAGKIILGLLHKAARVAEANSQHALELAQKLSHQLHAAENPDRRARGRSRDLSRQGRPCGGVATQSLCGDRESISGAGRRPSWIVAR